MSDIKYKGKYFTNNRRAVHIKNEEVQEMIDEIIEGMKKSKENDYRYIATGDVLVIGFRHYEEDEITIIVTQNYNEATFIYDKLGGTWEPVQYGSEAKLCPICNGTGFRINEYVYGEDGEDIKKEICEDCFGEGKIWM